MALRLGRSKGLRFPARTVRRQTVSIHTYSYHPSSYVTTSPGKGCKCTDYRATTGHLLRNQCGDTHLVEMRKQ